MIKKIRGESNETGFKLIINKKLTFKTTGYKEELENKVEDSAKMYAVFFLITMATISYYTLMRLPMHPPYIIIIIMPLFSLLLATAVTVKRVRKQWHALEHKVCEFFSNNKQIKIENITISTLKIIPSYSKKCGSAILFPIIVSSGIILYITPLYNLQGFWLNCLGIIIAIVIGDLMSTLFLNRILQKSLLLAEPTDEQYKEGLRLAQEIAVFFQKS